MLLGGNIEYNKSNQLHQEKVGCASEKPGVYSIL